MGRQTRKHHGSSQSKQKGHLENAGGVGTSGDSVKKKQKKMDPDRPKSSIGDGVTIEER